MLTNLSQLHVTLLVRHLKHINKTALSGDVKSLIDGLTEYNITEYMDSYNSKLQQILPHQGPLRNTLLKPDH